MFSKIVINKYFVIVFVVLICIMSGLGVYHRYKTQQILNAEAVKVFKVDTTTQNKHQKSVVGNKESLSKNTKNDDIDVNQHDNDNANVVSLESSQSDNDIVDNKVLEQPSDTSIGTVNIENDSDKPDPFRKLTREEMIERAVAVGMPREQAERMQPADPAMFDAAVSEASRRRSQFQYGTKEYFDATDEMLDIWANSSDPGFRVAASFTKRDIDGKPATQWEIYQHSLDNND